MNKRGYDAREIEENANDATGCFWLFVAGWVITFIVIGTVAWRIAK